MTLIIALAEALASLAQINADQVVAIGRNVLAMDDYLLAIQYFNRAIKAKPYMADPYFYRALAKLELEDYEGAERDCTDAIERNPFKVEAYKLRGFVRQQTGRDSLAVLDYDRGLQHNPEDKYFLFYKGIAQTALKQCDSAENTLASLLRKYPNFEDGYVARANLKLVSADTVGALENLGKALSISKNLVNAYLLRTSVYAEQKRWEEALADMDEVIKLQPREPSLYVNRAYLRYNSNDYFGAMSDYNYALELDPANSMALFNRALLRFEVRDLNNAEADFTKVLAEEPDNFYALYNRGLIYIDTRQYKKALADFDRIISIYPKFYLAYYAKAQIYQDMGQQRKALECYYAGEDMVRKYVRNPKANPLDRPTIQAGKTNNTARAGEEESEMEVIEKFNQLMTVSEVDDAAAHLSFNEKIKGRVQDRNLNITPEPFYFISVLPAGANLQIASNYFPALNDFNAHKYIRETLYLVNPSTLSLQQSESERLFSRLDDYNKSIGAGSDRPADYLARAVIHTVLRDYSSAIQDLDRVLTMMPGFEIALMQRAAVYYFMSCHDSEMPQHVAAKAALADLSALLEKNPRHIYAWFDKGMLHYDNRDYTSALESFSRAIELFPEFGNAYYNRGLTYLQLGDKARAMNDLSKAGELGVLPSYNLLKRMK